MARAVRVVQVALLVAVVAFTVSTLPGVRGDPGFHTWLDGWLQGGAYVLTAVLAALRPLTSQLHRLLWSLVALALGLRALGFVLYLAVIRTMDPVPYPSVSDALWIAMTVVLLGAVWLAVRRHAEEASLMLLLDALLAALLAGGLVIGLFYDTLQGLAAPGAPAHVVATNLAYPLMDVALVVLVLTGITTMRANTSTSTWLLCAGVVGFAVVDTLFLRAVTEGTYHPGTLLASLSLWATAAIALAAWAPEKRWGPRLEVEAGIMVTALLMFGCVAIVAYAAFRPVFGPGVLLAAGGLVVAPVRGLLTLARSRRETAARQAELLRFQALVEASGEFIAMARADGRLLYLNPAGRALIGVDEGVDVTGTFIRDYLTPEALEVMERDRAPTVLAGGRWEGQSSLRDLRGGPEIPVAVSTFLMRHPESGQPLGMGTVQRDLRERLAAERALRDLAEQRQVLLGRLVQAQEDERQRIAAEVHDDSVQAVAAVEIRLNMVRRQLEQAAPELLDGLDKAREAVASATDRLRHLLFDLDSPAGREDLATALGEAAAFVLEDDIPWSVTGDVTIDLPVGARVTAYRIAKEALVNVRKHAHASRVEVAVRRVGGGVEVAVTDDGRGVDSEQLLERPGHRGVATMRDRAVVAGGRLAVEPGAGGGTVVRLWLPATDGMPGPEGG